jgi:uncharacterized protein YceH (UPF0502 family)
MHLLSGPIDIEAHANQAQAARKPGPERASVSDLAQRVDVLEADIAELRSELLKMRESPG